MAKPPHWCDWGAFYPVLGAGELPAAKRYTTDSYDKNSKAQEYYQSEIMSSKILSQPRPTTGLIHKANSV
jgi:hypothetical protein